MKMNKVKLLNKCISELKRREGKGAGPAGKKVGKGKADGGEPLGEEVVRKKSLLRPEDQLSLSEAELREEIGRTLSPGNINSPKNLVEFSYSLGEFVLRAEPSGTVVLIHVEGCCIPKDSPEAQAQIAAGGWEGERQRKRQAVKQKSSSLEREEGEGEGEGQEGGEGGEGREGEGEGEGEERGEEEEPEQEGSGGGGGKRPGKKLTNAFNFCERGALTVRSSRVNASTQTIPPPRKVFSELVTQWVIYDAYAEDFERQQKEREKEKETKKGVSGSQPGRKEEARRRAEPQGAEVLQQRTNEAAKILDRMICQNICDEIAQDYKYYEDPSDEYRQEEGTLLPLWKFCFERTKRNSVTDISWNPQYHDLFAVTFGTFDFLKVQSQEGAVCLFTLKNPSYPEYARATESGAMCVATHPTQSQLLAVGLVDGNVAVYNARLGDRGPQFESNSVNRKHWGIVWQVKWGADMQDGEVNFFSVAADGKVYNWVVMQNELAVTTVVSLSLPVRGLVGPDGAEIGVRDCGCCISFHPLQPLIFLVGTEEGNVYKCSTAYSSIFLYRYDAHHMPVHRISHNPFCPDIFLTCSADWRVKVWEDLRREPLFVFDLGCSVGDVQWAPYSSTVFAGVTVDGRCHVFDISVNKYRAVCVQSVRRSGVTRVRFSPRMPVVAAGDERGGVTVLKLSPNLRVRPKVAKKQQFCSREELEAMKLEKLLILVREPATGREGREGREGRSEGEV